MGAKNPVPLPKSLAALRLCGDVVPVLIPWESAGPGDSSSDEEVQGEEAKAAALGSCRRKGEVSLETLKPCHGWEVTHGCFWSFPHSSWGSLCSLPSHPVGSGC